jgi:AraC-like DNA-binding protein
MRELTVAASVVRALMELAVSKGASRKSLTDRSRIALPDLENPDTRIPFSKYVALMRAAQQLCNDPAFALHFGEEVDASEISLAHMMGGADNIGEALAVGNRYARLAIEVDADGSGDRFQLRRVAGQLWFVDARGNPNEFPELSESTFARMACSMRKLPGDRQIVKAVCFTHDDPGYRVEYERIFGVPVVFGSDMNAIRIDESLMSSFEFPTSSPYVTEVLRNHAEGLLQKLESERSTRDQVEKLLTPLLQSGEGSMHLISDKLCCSRQTLFRKLKSEGVTFEQVLDELRHKLSLNYLNANKISVKETARLVGYSDSAAFSRAFKRWTGSSPREYLSRGEFSA